MSQFNSDRVLSFSAVRTVTIFYANVNTHDPIMLTNFRAHSDPNTTNTTLHSPRQHSTNIALRCFSITRQQTNTDQTDRQTGRGRRHIHGIFLLTSHTNITHINSHSPAEPCAHVVHERDRHISSRYNRDTQTLITTHTDQKLFEHFQQLILKTKHNTHTPHTQPTNHP